MKQFLSITFLFLLNLTTKAQADSEGIHFEQDVTWNQVLQKAKQQHKNIFVDCYATWCGPCKKMEAEVYPKKEVGDVYNKDFINVRLQMDQTPKDDEEVKKWYGAANNFKTNYSVNSFPTFLFFDENGKPLHKVSASEDPDQFIQLAKDALNPDKQYYNILKNFQPNTLDTAEEKGLARSFVYSDKVLAGKIAADYLSRIPKEQLHDFDNGLLMVQTQDNPEVLNIALGIINEQPLAKSLNFIAALSKQQPVHEIAINYIKGLSNEQINDKKNLEFIEKFNKEAEVKTIAEKYLDQLSENEFFTPDNIQFAISFIDTSASRAFRLIYNNPVKVDTIMHRKGLSRSLVYYLAYNEEVRFRLSEAMKSGKEPDWQETGKSIEQKFGSKYEKYPLLFGKINWYAFKKDWKHYSTYFIERAEMDSVEKGEGFNGMFALNNAAWDIFQHSENKKELEKALSWTDIGIKLIPDPPGYIFDTKANLLYKLGRTKEAMATEKLALQKEPKRKEYLEAIDKMQKGEKTW